MKQLLFFILICQVVNINSTLSQNNCSIGSVLFVDSNDNGIFDSGENTLGEAGYTVTINLVDANTDAVIGATTTDTDGEYVFDNLEEGDYIVQFDPPSTYPISSTITDNNDNQEDNDDNGSQIDTDGDGVTDGLIQSPTITLSEGDEPIGDPGIESTPDENGDNTIDFGLVPEPSIDDADGDGVEDSLDSCPDDYNPFQEDVDGDGIGDECDPQNIVTQLHEVQDNIYANKLYSGIILQDQAGGCWMIVVQEDGGIKTISIVCP